MRITYYHFQSVDSTNAFAARHRHHFSPDEFAVITTEQQTAGKGTKGRSWTSSGHDKSIAISFAFFDNSSDPVFFTKIAALSCHAILQEHGIAARIKWPNDLIVGNKKIVGILAEAVFTEESRLIIVGIGINVNLDATDLAAIDQPATSIFHEAQKAANVAEIEAALTKKFIGYLSVPEERVEVLWKEYSQ